MSCCRSEIETGRYLSPHVASKTVASKVSCDGRPGQCSVDNSEQSFELAFDGSMQLQWCNHWTGVLSYTVGFLTPCPCPASCIENHLMLVGIRATES